VYYPGYGIEFEGDNYLNPGDARLDARQRYSNRRGAAVRSVAPAADSPQRRRSSYWMRPVHWPFQIQGGRLAPDRRDRGRSGSAVALLVRAE